MSKSFKSKFARFVGGLGYNLRDVPATNIVFTRDRSCDTHPDLDGDAARCWPIHIFMMRMVKPKVIIAFGSGESDSPFAYLRQFLKPANVETISAGQDTFSCHRFTSSIEGRPTNIVIVPHLTRYSPYAAGNYGVGKRMDTNLMLLWLSAICCVRSTRWWYTLTGQQG